jgi:hypothetical protein
MYLCYSLLYLRYSMIAFTTWESKHVLGAVIVPV